MDQKLQSGQLNAKEFAQALGLEVTFEDEEIEDEAYCTKDSRKNRKYSFPRLDMSIFIPPTDLGEKTTKDNGLSVNTSISALTTCNALSALSLYEKSSTLPSALSSSTLNNNSPYLYDKRRTSDAGYHSLPRKLSILQDDHEKKIYTKGRFEINIEKSSHFYSKSPIKPTSRFSFVDEVVRERRDSGCSSL